MARNLTSYRNLMMRLGLDPRAVEAVARGEGGLSPRPGLADVGDLSGGGSFGPFQLYTQGALPRNIARLPTAQRDAWAWSPAGIQYALGRIASVARGQKGEQAVRSIITKFERPADPGKSIRNALGRLGSSPAAAPTMPELGVAPGLGAKRKILLQGLVQGRDIFDMIPDIAAARGAAPTPAAPLSTTPAIVPRPASAGSGAWGGSKSLADQLSSVTGLRATSEKRDRQSTASGGVSDHWTGSKNAYAKDLGGSVASMDAAAVKLARSLGIPYKKGQRLEATVNRGGHRVQVLYRTNTGGNHFDHIHLGVRRR